MNEKKKKSKSAKYLVLGLIFLLIFVLSLSISLIYQKSREEAYSSMAKASLPTVSVKFGKYETELHGYVTEMTLSDMRDVIVPVGKDRKLSLTVHGYGNDIASVRYWVRSLDGKEYIDGATIEKPEESQGEYDLQLTFSELLKSGTEYHLQIDLGTGEREVYYYTRIFVANTIYSEELLDFADTFSRATYDREKADFIVNYIQPEDKSGTDDYSRIDIHSKYSMFTFGSLTVERGQKIRVRISELESTQMSVLFTYDVRILDGDVWRVCRTEEFFTVRYRNGRKYLLDYYRTLDETFSPDRSTKEKGRITLGIENRKNTVLTSGNGTYTVFEKNRELWLYNAKTNSMNMVFSFRDDADTSGRSDYDHHEILPVKASSDGSVDYMVYGYMNRGSYEGQVGICFYRYDAGKNATRRLFYVPVYQSELMLMMDLGALAYVNEGDVCYLRYGDGIYSIDLNSGESVEVSIRAYPGLYAKNEKGNVVAWVEGSDLSYPERLVILNLDSQTTTVVNAEEGEYVKILDFIGDDIVYGFGKESDSVIFANIDVRQLLNRIIIASTDEGLTIQQEYASKEFYILSVGVYDTRVTIQRGVKDENGELVPMEDDVLLITQDVGDTTDKSMVMRRNENELKRTYYIQISKATNVDSQFSEVAPRFEMLREANVIALVHHQHNAYYVYGYGKLLSVESELNLAIREAYEVFGVVVDADLNDLWTRGTRDLVKTISIQPYRSDGTVSSLAAAIQVLSAQEGMQIRDAEKQLIGGASPMEIINGAIGEEKAINLYGCTLQEVLYFINEGRPVMAITGNREAVVIVGYDQDNVLIYDPATGETVKEPQKSAAALFEGFNHLFLSYR